MYISGDDIKLIIFGASKFWSIIFSNPSPIEHIKKREGIVPIRVAQKKLTFFTSNIHGNTFEIANGIPPTNL